MFYFESSLRSMRKAVLCASIGAMTFTSAGCDKTKDPKPDNSMPTLSTNETFEVEEIFLGRLYDGAPDISVTTKERNGKKYRIISEPDLLDPNSTVATSATTIMGPNAEILLRDPAYNYMKFTNANPMEITVTYDDGVSKERSAGAKKITYKINKETVVSVSVIAEPEKSRMMESKKGAEEIVNKVFYHISNDNTEYAPYRVNSRVRYY